MFTSFHRIAAAALVLGLASPVPAFARAAAPAAAAPASAAADAASSAPAIAPPPNRASGSSTVAGPRLQTLAREVVYAWAAAHPLYATQLGLADEDGKLDVPSEASEARDLATIRGWQARLAAIPLDGATLVERDDAALLRARLTSQARQYTVYESDRKDYSAPAVAIVNGVFTQFQHLPVAGADGATASDVRTAWARITSRLNAAPAYVAGGESLVTKPGHLQGVTGAEQLAGAPDFMSGALTDAARAQLDAGAFARFAAARDAALASIAAAKTYIDAHAASWPENFAMGRTAYDAMLKDEQLLPYDANAVEQMGTDELAHGWAVSSWVRQLARESATALGPSTGGGLAPGGPALVDYYRSRIADLDAFVTKQHVIDVPAWLGKIDVVETPKFLQPVSPGASMNAPLLFSHGSTGFYFITPPTSLAAAAERLDANQDFDRDRILSTGAHEAMPGHFLQLSIARRNPDFVRKIQDSGVFAEGWAFYGEEMFVQLGLYGDDIDAREFTAQWERVRGARATVDPKLASGEWSVAQATDFFEKQTGFSADQSKEAIAGYALQPGYVISYTVGRLQLEALLAQYRARTGAAGSLEDFDDRLMCYGTTPFAVVGPELLADLARPLAEVRAAARY